jgi:ribosomal peptide maturation radical SAM protein 1
MPKVSLINMPFASLNLPSIGLTQIKVVLDKRFGERVDTQIYYLCYDFAHFIGVPVYKTISSAAQHHNSGFGDWLFRQIAFPDHEDNADQYYTRYYPQRDESAMNFRSHMQRARAELDAFLDGVITKYKLDESDVVGLTSMFTQHVASLAMARKIKERNPNVITVMGGANCESPMGQEIVNNVDYIDYVFSGPALKNFPEMIQNFLDGQVEKSSTIKGVLCKANCAAPAKFVRIGGPATSTAAAPHSPIGEELDIDECIELNYDQFLDKLEENFPRQEVSPVLLFETSRGCWWGARSHCTFCGLNGVTMSYRAMTPENALKQFASMFKYADRANRINCVDNILAKNYFKEVLPMISPPPNVNLFYEVKADLSEEEVETLARARVKTIQPGIESLATSTLKLMKKGTTVFQNIFLLKNCISHGIHPEWNLLIGFPGEGDDVYKKYVRDLPLLTHLAPPSGVFPVRFDRYSPYFMRAEEYGLDLQPTDYYELIYPFGKESLRNLAYYFTDLNFGAQYFLLMAKWIGKIREKHRVWETLWSSDSQALRPQLHFKENGESNVVYDSRAGKAIEHRLDEPEAQALRLMHSRAKRLSDLTAGLSHIPGFDAERSVALLQEKGLIFQENDKYMSLVIPREPQDHRSVSVTVKRAIGSPKLPGVESFRT